MASISIREAEQVDKLDTPVRELGRQIKQAEDARIT
jgi:hypothetical protein